MVALKIPRGSFVFFKKTFFLVFVVKLCLGYYLKAFSFRSKALLGCLREMALVNARTYPRWSRRLISLGSSETTREAFLAQKNRYKSYFQFNEYVKRLPQHKKRTHLGDYSFLEWFIGFTEGDGCFGVQNNRPYFRINQADLRLMLKLRSKLGFGVVTTFTQEGRTYARFSVYDHKGVQRLICLFNGNIHLEKVQNRFGRWVTCYNQCYRESIVIKPRLAVSLISLETAWFSGFFDAEGCCYAGLSKDSFMSQGVRLRLKACVDQKLERDVLQQLCSLFQVSKLTVRNKQKDYYRVEMVSKQSLQLVVKYLTKYKLQGRKNQCFAIWLKLCNAFVNKVHLSTEVDVLQRKVKKIQSFNQEFKRVKSVFTLFTEEIEKDL